METSMTKEEVSEYIFDQKIPISFVFETIVYEIHIWVDGYTTSTKSNKHFDKFPIWNIIKLLPHSLLQIKVVKINSFKDILNLEKPTFEESLIEFLYWWEINKSRFTNIEYYK